MAPSNTKPPPRVQPNKMPSVNRYIMLDVLRGFAVLLMIFFHGAFDLNWFYFIDINILKDPFWFWLPRFIVFLFLICVGMSLALVHKNGIRWNVAIKRFVKIGGWALVITVVTYILYPKNYVFFGVLHCIATTSFVGVVFVNRPKLSLVLCVVLVISDMIFQPTLIPISKWLGVTSIDYIPFYPWFGVVLFGIYLEFIQFHKISLKRNFLIRSMEFMGKHSLKIYLMHRPILFGTVFLLHKFQTTGNP